MEEAGRLEDFGVGSAMRVKFRPQPVWNLIVLLLRKVLVPPTEVT